MALRGGWRPPLVAKSGELIFHFNLGVSLHRRRLPRGANKAEWQSICPLVNFSLASRFLRARLATSTLRDDHPAATSLRDIRARGGKPWQGRLFSSPARVNI
jgi:hypothetical protein